MYSIVKRKAKIQYRLGELRRGKWNHCWVCGSTSGVKTSRVSTGTRCVKCIEKGRITSEVVEYDRLKAELAKLNA